MESRYGHVVHYRTIEVCVHSAMTMRRGCDDDVDLDKYGWSRVQIRNSSGKKYFFHPALIRRCNFLQCYMFRQLNP